MTTSLFSRSIFREIFSCCSRVSHLLRQMYQGKRPQGMIPAIIMAFCVGKSLECDQKNTSCNGIKTGGGFKFPHGGPEGSEIYVYDNETVLIAYASLGDQSFEFMNKVMSMDNYSVITRDCQDLQVKHIVHHGERFVKEICLDYKITEKLDIDSTDSPTPIIIGIIFGVISLIVIIVIIPLCYVSWKKLLKKQHGANTVSELTFMLSFLRLGISKAQKEEEEGVGLNEMGYAPDPPGSGVEQDNTLDSVHVHSIDPTAEGKTTQSLSLDRSLSNEGIQPPKNGDITAPDIYRASNHRAKHRKVRDDPGGENDNKGKDRDTANGCTVGVSGPEDQENEGQTLLLDQRAAIQGEAAVSSTAPDTDVEST
ncbi:uncharacterized protein LOC127357108 isoform X1 [Dicentrarchus labrax]|uniref:uncharacterized protein LOC127357108 isoform X1 n=1 Tax=Dicentrarchus labrax TaxID=13489 RepID=UPI0021F547D8|nr:uncharacterized protein LOC127357108 isoform X1 [Dicentrarchus labrax]